MSDKLKIARKRLPTWWPINGTATVYLLLRVTDAPGWVRGVAWTLVVILWLGATYSIFTEEERDPFDRRLS